MSSSPPSFYASARDRFFSIDELVTLFLEQAPTLVLINCQRVCQKWREIISDSPLLQQHLFLQPSSNHDQEPMLNPILWQRFGPVLATESGDHQSRPWTTYQDLSLLPCAKDSTTKEAFARSEASWRPMLISQPPITRLDWWHTWRLSAHPAREDDWGTSGWGHQDLNDTPITLDMLWDLLESRLYRGCRSTMTFYPAGMDPARDPAPVDEEVEWAREEHGEQHHGYRRDLARVRLRTEQVWSQRPRAHERFHFRTREWEVNERKARHEYEGDGFNVLRQDCRQDYGYVDDEGEDCRRWSRSEGYAYPEIRGESSGWH